VTPRSAYYIIAIYRTVKRSS